MFSIKQKKEISDKVQKILKDTLHPELPDGEIKFNLHVEGAESWSWADIKNNKAVPELLPLTPLIVWNNDERYPMKRIFSHFKDEKVWCFDDGSFSGPTSSWNHYKVDHSIFLIPGSGMLPICDKMPEAKQYLVEIEGSSTFVLMLNRRTVLRYKGYYKVLK